LIRTTNCVLTALFLAKSASKTMNKLCSTSILVLLTVVTSLGQLAPAQAQKLPSNINREKIRDILNDILGPSPSPAPTGNPTTAPAPSVPNPPAPSQGSDLGNSDGSVSRAMNLARQAAERANGGLSVYRAEPAMYGPSEKAPYVVNKDSSITFTFLGGKPSAPPIIQSVVTVTRDGSNVKMDYNGPIRSAN
jgi:hypothetical protein